MDVLLPCAAAVAILMLVVWAVSVRVHDASIVDPVWGPAFVLVALVAAFAGDGSGRTLLLVLVAVWGLRLGWHLTRRKLAEPEEDRRYAQMRARKGDAFALWSLRMVFATQGVLVLVVSLPITQADGDLGAGAVPGVVLWLVGLVFEAVGDAQLSAFKADPQNRGKVMDRGLWAWTRHPNYFGDACVWWGLWLVGLAAGAPLWTVVGPVVMTVLLVRVSGARLLEQDIGDRRPAYADYIRRTSGFLPRPPRA